VRFRVVAETDDGLGLREDPDPHDRAIGDRSGLGEDDARVDGVRRWLAEDHLALVHLSGGARHAESHGDGSLLALGGVERGLGEDDPRDPVGVRHIRGAARHQDLLPRVDQEHVVAGIAIQGEACASFAVGLDAHEVVHRLPGTLEGEDPPPVWPVPGLPQDVGNLLQAGREIRHGNVQGSPPVPDGRREVERGKIEAVEGARALDHDREQWRVRVGVGPGGHLDGRAAEEREGGGARQEGHQEDDPEPPVRSPDEDVPALTEHAQVAPGAGEGKGPGGRMSRSCQARKNEPGAGSPEPPWASWLDGSVREGAGPIQFREGE
jgi:hypothetical protein